MPDTTPTPASGRPVGPHGPARSMLITAGPTHEPIDAVRFIGNRSSGRLGIALADAAAGRGWEVTLLLGPVDRQPSDSRVALHRFRTCSDLQALLAEHAPRCGVLVMAAAVADYRPKVVGDVSTLKLRRSAGPMTIDLEPTPDLLAGVSARRLPGQVLVGFALEPRDRLEASAREKLERKGVDLVVANPLETMDDPRIEATLFGPSGPVAATPGRIDKSAFAGWLLDRLEGAGSVVRLREAGAVQNA